MPPVQAAAVWAVSACAVIGMLVRPWRSPEWTWAVGGAVAAALAGGMSVHDAGAALLRGIDVYAFLIGILSLAELARSERVFDIVAIRMLRAAGGSQGRLFALIYGCGTIVTALLSNDTTVVVLTPAVLAALGRTRSAPLPYLYICAFVANAASFLLPISNPANLVLFGRSLPPLLPWVRAFGLAAVAAVVLTFVALRLIWGGQLRTPYSFEDDEPPITRATVWTSVLLGLSALALVTAALLGINVGYTALAAAVISVCAIAVRAPVSASFALRHTTWSIVPLVAGLFVIVAALDRSGAIDLVRAMLHQGESFGALGTLYVGTLEAIAANLFNNLPVALASAVAVASMHAASRIVDAALVAIDLGPNLSVSGSLATLLWLVVLRRDGIDVTAWQFLRTGVIVLLPALVAALLLVR